MASKGERGLPLARRSFVVVAVASSLCSLPFSWTILLCRFDIRVTRETVAEADSAAMDLHDMSSGMADVTM